MIDIRKLSANHIILTRHARDKMNIENILLEDIKLVIDNATPKLDNSARNNKTHAWNTAPHYTLSFNNLTVVVCESLERALLVCTVYHGLPHKIETNPYMPKRLY